MKRTRGFTLIEMMISLIVLGVVMAGAILFFRSVSRAVSGTSDRMDAMQNLRYALSTLDREMRNTGAGTTGTQPQLVYISPNMVVFNADLVSLTAGSATAVNYDPDANPNAVAAPTTSQKFFIPGTSIQYPDSTYRTTGGELSPAETVVYWFTPDSTAAAGSGLYLLLRQVNNNAPDVVARNLLPYPGQPFFNWQISDTIGNLSFVAAATLPLRHSVPVHGSTADTGLAAKIDSIRAVQVYAYASNGMSGTQQVLRQLVTTIAIPNAGLAKQLSCGDPPIFGQAVTATWNGDTVTPKITLAWPAATDETAGQKDVQQYLIYRRTAAGSFADALQTVPAGHATYTYIDPTVLADSSYVYQIAALDCTPTESTPSTSNTVLIP
ncbi:MAG TPA: prepilin-type N-terminal cleavage/methylation domain-containing protein [Gemmatimonadales bacterium]|nr:prepilin-type N-terminal cleavage/methylation domain-containing protein [Gemmatimonadales bacterium]